LKEAELSFSAAESCTGGVFSAAVTSIPGASEIFCGGIVAYSPGVKSRILGVDVKRFSGEEVYSPECALALANGVRSACQSDVAVGITGVAGPDGGTERYPIGSVSIAVVGLGKEAAELFHYEGTREEIRREACVDALRLVHLLVSKSS
ncbi:MAG: CinA family protein, partial [Deltaproteobacteria bacterium]|nr:CinA family protein [Deltaproteobacteria bacterium]